MLACGHRAVAGLVAAVLAAGGVIAGGVIAGAEPPAEEGRCP
jgi:hypothetical protein